MLLTVNGVASDAPVLPFQITFKDSPPLKVSVVGNRLVLWSEASIGKLFALTNTTIKFGRQNDNDIILPSYHATRRHCILNNTSDGMTLTDYSKNGTIVDDLTIHDTTTSHMQVPFKLNITGVIYTISKIETVSGADAVVVDTMPSDVDGATMIGDFNTPYRCGDNIITVDTINCAYTSHIGSRNHMEDTCDMMPGKGLFGVYDGHGGRECSEYLSKHLLTRLCKNSQLFLHDPTTVLNSINQEIYDNGIASGSTAVFCIVDDSNEKVTVFNTGDSRAMLIHMNEKGSSFEITDAHRPDATKEKARIQALHNNDIELIERPGDVMRVRSIRARAALSVSRGFGDVMFKGVIIPDADKYVWSTKSSDVLILGSDGVWDYIEPSEILNVLSSIKPPITSKRVANVLVNYIIDKKKGRDNVMVMVVLFC